jgi:hypothetical protein
MIRYGKILRDTKVFESNSVIENGAVLEGAAVNTRLTLVWYNSRVYTLVKVNERVVAISEEDQDAFI